MIPSNDFTAQWQDCSRDILDACSRVGQSGWYVLGKEVASFEQELAATWQIPHAIGTANGMDAIEIALRAAGLQQGELVLTTPLSAFASSLAIIRAGGIPVFSDTDATGLLDLNLASKVLAQQPDIRWLLPVHLYGHCLDLDHLRTIQQQHGVRILEDCAQSIGATHHGQPCGSAGFAAATSFYPTKNLGALGDGGAILTSNPDLADTCRSLRDYGQTAKYQHEHLGLNSRLDELQAAILRSAFLPRLAASTERRRTIAAAYHQHLANPAVATLPAPPHSHSVHHLFPIRITAGKRASFMHHLQQHGVSSAIHYPGLIPDQSAMQHTRFSCATPLETARSLASSEVSLPIHPYLTDAQLDHIIATVNQWTP